MRLSLLRQALFSKHPYFAQLPSNVAWQDNLPTKVAALVERDLINVFDIGARQASVPELDHIKRYISYVGFDADEEECARLNAMPKTYGRELFLPSYISGRSGPVDFNLYKSRGCSSRFAPGKRFGRLFAEQGQIEIERSVRLEGQALEEVTVKHGLPAADLIKVDTQGSELEILKGFKNSLSKVHLVEVEVEFVEQYAGQPLFYEVCSFMQECGYDLIFLNRVIKQRRNIYSGPARGQMIFGDALFCRREELLGDESDEKLTKLIVLLWCYGHRDIAFDICQNQIRSGEIKTALAQLFDTRNYNRMTNKIRQFIVGKLDAFALIWMALRRTNGLRSDHDRSWPIR